MNPRRVCVFYLCAEIICPVQFCYGRLLRVPKNVLMELEETPPVLTDSLQSLAVCSPCQWASVCRVQNAAGSSPAPLSLLSV